jgi:nucleoside-diphosphate-sugar epimerase
MRVFVTGATGFVGSAVVRELVAAGHQVSGLARSPANKATLAALGAASHEGNLDDLESLRAGASAADGVIHCGYNHDFTNYAGAAQTDRSAIEAMVEALAGSGKPLVITSGTAALRPGRLSTEADLGDASSPGAMRLQAEAIAVAGAQRGVRTAVIRLSPSTHGAGDHGFVPMLIEGARKAGAVAYVGDGANRWPAVHRLDAARLYRLVLERAAPGTRWHAVAEEGIAVREIAGAIARGLGLPTQSITAEEAGARLGFVGFFLGVDTPASSAHTRATFAWTPQHPGLLPDIAAHYFATETVAP